MSGQAVTTVGFFGKLPAHGDFVRRGLPAAVTTLLDDWLQREFGRHGGAALATIAPLRFAATTLLAGHLGLGALVGSSDSVGRTYVAVALRLSDHPLGLLPDPIPPAWDDWTARAEALLLAAHVGAWTADATQAMLEASGAATVLALIEPPPMGVPDDAAGVAVWRAKLDGEPVMMRFADLPAGDAFDRLIAAPERVA